MPHTATPLLASARLRALESAHAAAQPPLMERAGRAAADFARHLLGGRDGAILIVCGPGNNGGDGFVMARELRAAGHVVHVVCATAPESLPADAQAAHASWLAAGGTVHDTLPVDVATQPWALTVDALFGIGLTRAPAGVYAEQIDALNALAAPCLALDLPSGLDGDRGAAFVPCVRADHTLSFIAAKPGLYTADGPDHAGAVRVADLGLADDIAAARELATRYRAHVVVKGCGSVIATPDGTPCINASGHAGLASAGTGDVLSGLCVALLAQHWPAREALLAAVHLHGAAADLLAANDYGPIGLTAGELADAARAVFNGWCQQR